MQIAAPNSPEVMPEALAFEADVPMLDLGTPQPLSAAAREVMSSLGLLPALEERRETFGMLSSGSVGVEMTVAADQPVGIQAIKAPTPRQQPTPESLVSLEDSAALDTSSRSAGSAVVTPARRDSMPPAVPAEPNGTLQDEPEWDAWLNLDLSEIELQL